MMGRGKKIDDKKREQIRAHYASCGNQRETARRFGVSPTTVKRLVDDKKDDVEQLRTHKKKQWVNEAWKTIGLYMDHVQDEKVIKRTSARDSAILIGTLHDKILKQRELEIKQQEVDLKKQEVENPAENRVVIVNDKDAMRKAMQDADRNKND